MIELVTTVFVFAFPAIVVAAAVSDAASFTIPNWMSAALVLLFPLAAYASGLSLETVGLCLLVGFGGLVVGMGMFAVGWIGGGDAKLFAASALWLGLPALAPFVMTTAIAGGVLAVALMTLRSNRISPMFAVGPAWLNRLATPGESVPYGIAIAFGALAAFPQAPIAQRALLAF